MLSPGLTYPIRDSDSLLASYNSMKNGKNKIESLYHPDSVQLAKEIVTRECKMSVMFKCNVSKFIYTLGLVFFKKKMKLR